MKVDVHYYEDGNVRLLTEKPVIGSTSSSPTTTDVMRQIVVVERKYQEDLNRAFISLSEGAFKSLRRQLPVTRQKVEWEKISGYRVSFTWNVIGILLIVYSWDRISVVVVAEADDLASCASK